ncbi:cellulase family glycosylhydrolase [Rugamonas apoptosis]|uniref:Cellulase family glycosylhydrolase n=1 Tax=Rugamonas apoptosis TaxID=2758570 RepID=A0A7W2IKM4_9BURK|nr:cellulase family glycosylhydrolase [Rugamonas apoptosis]MBA5687511.1 cellulase family glycosylhydrolase [Rugamonas apoptosis]
MASKFALQMMLLIGALGGMQGSAYSADAATFISQQVPNSMEAAQPYTVSVTYKNTGTTVWHGDGPHPFKLGARNPTDNQDWGLDRVELAPGERIAPGQLKTFTFTVTAPEHTEGAQLERNFQWGVLQEKAGWLHPGVNVVVGIAYAPPITTQFPPLLPPVAVDHEAFRFSNFKGANILQRTYRDDRSCNHTHGLPDAAQMALIAERAVAMGLNVLRLPVVIPPRTPGTPAKSGLGGNICRTPSAPEWESADSAVIMRRLEASTKTVLDTAASHGLKVVLVLDGYTKYDQVCFWKQSFLDVRANASAFVQRFKSHSALLAWDVMNEPLWNASAYGCLASQDDYQSVVDAIHAMYNVVRAADAVHPTTVGEHKVPFLKYWTDISSYASPHLYIDTDEKVELGADVTDLDQINFVQQATLSELAKVNPELPMVIGEFGVSANDRTADRYKADYYERYLNGLARDGRGFMLWDLSLSPLPAQQDISLLAPDGSLKTAARAVARQQWYPVVQQLFLAYTGRPADPAALRSFANLLLDVDRDMGTRSQRLERDLMAVNRAYDSQAALRDAIGALYASREFQHLYQPEHLPGYISSIYLTALGRLPAANGLAYWSDRINYAGLSRQQAPLAILATAHANHSPQGETDAATLRNKSDVAAYFSASLNTQARTDCFSGQGPAHAAAALLQQVDASTDVQRFLPLVDANLSTMCHL